MQNFGSGPSTALIRIGVGKDIVKIFDISPNLVGKPVMDVQDGSLKITGIIYTNMIVELPGRRLAVFSLYNNRCSGYF